MVATRRRGLTAICQTDFQSPFRRGNGCYSRLRVIQHVLESPFSPLFVGAMVATLVGDGGTVAAAVLSVPFSSGQWLLLFQNIATHIDNFSFSPLFIGAMVATVPSQA